jgi:hypothetical protein
MADQATVSFLQACEVTGSSSKNVVPSPTVDSTRMVPFRTSTQSATIDKPKPSPLVPSCGSRSAYPR